MPIAISSSTGTARSAAVCGGRVVLGAAARLAGLLRRPRRAQPAPRPAVLSRTCWRPSCSACFAEQPRFAGRSLVRYTADLGLLSERMNVIHAIWVDDADLDLIADAGAVIAHNPVSNLRLGSGVMPFRAFASAAFRSASAATKRSPTIPLNMWGVLKTAGLIHNIADPDYERWPTRPTSCSTASSPAAPARWDVQDQLGAVEAGRLADLILIDLDTLAFTPLNDLKRQLVYCENGSSVALTMVAGRIVFEDGRVTTIDEQALRAEARELFERRRRRSRRRGARPTAGCPTYRAWCRRRRRGRRHEPPPRRSRMSAAMLSTHGRYRTRRSPPARTTVAERCAPGGLCGGRRRGIPFRRRPDRGHPAGTPRPDFVNTAWRDYGNRVGGFRLLDRLESRGIAPTVLLNTEIYDHAPALMAAARGGGSGDRRARQEQFGHAARHGAAAEGRLSATSLTPSNGPRAPLRRVVEPVARAHRADLRPAGRSRLSLPPRSADGRPAGLARDAAGAAPAIPYALELNDSSTIIGRKASARGSRR